MAVLRMHTERTLMPHITVDYSARLDGLFDRQAFVREVHPTVLEETGSTGVCKTFFRPAA